MKSLLRNRLSVCLIPLLCAPLWVPLAHAEDLVQVYELALESDPGLKAAAAEREATRMERPLAESGLRPTVTLSADADWSYTSSQVVDDDDLVAGAAVSATLPLYRRDRSLRIGQAGNRINAAEASYTTEEQALMVRVAQAYFAILTAKDTLEFTDAELKAIERQLDQAKQRFEVGLIAITGVHEAQARFDQARASVIAQRNVLDNAWESLREIIGQVPERLAAASPDLPLEPPVPADVDEWSALALSNSPRVRAAREAAEVAKVEIEVQRAGDAPTLDLVGSASASRGLDLSSNDRESAAVGMQFALPLYTGGRVSAASDQARFSYQAALEGLDQTRRAVDREVRVAYRNVQDSISGIEALQASIVSAQSALDATEAGFEVGTRTLVDVLDSQSELFRVQSRYSEARYGYLINRLALRQAAGLMAPADLADINRWLR